MKYTFRFSHSLAISFTVSAKKFGRCFVDVVDACFFLVDHNSSLLPSGEIVHSWGFSFLPVYSLVQILVAVYVVANSNKTCGSFSFLFVFWWKGKAHFFYCGFGYPISSFKFL